MCAQKTSGARQASAATAGARVRSNPEQATQQKPELDSWHEAAQEYGVARLGGNPARRSSPTPKPSRGFGSQHPFFQVQQYLGNQAVLRRLQSGLDPATGIGSNTTRGMLQRKCACGGSCAKCSQAQAATVSPQATHGVQTKLTVNEPGDAFEQEADRVAEEVVQMPPSSAQPSWQSRPPAPLQRKAAEAFGRQTAAAAPSVQQALGSTGHAPDAATRTFMEPRLGFDMSRVRIHTDRTGAASARAISAKAFTTGNDIVFAEGQYRPETTEGRRLLAHELTHVAQQGGHPGAVQRKEEDSQKPAPTTWGTNSAIVQIKAEVKQTGAAWGYFADGNSTLIAIITNTLSPGQYTIRPAGPPQGATDADYIERLGSGFSWRESIANFHPDNPVTLIIQPAAADRFGQLPPYIQQYLLSSRGMTRPSQSALEDLAYEGERLLREGVTAADLELAADPDSRIEIEDKLDLVDSLRRRGFSDFPSREDYYKRLARELVGSSDYQRWWTEADIASYWKEFPEVAQADWNKFADKRYTEAKQTEEAAWLEAFRRIDAAAGAVNVIAVGTLFVAGGFAGAEMVALVPALPALPATIQGVDIAVWGKTLFAAGLSASYLEHVVSTSKDAADNGVSNTISIVSTAIDKTLGVGQVFEAATNQSLLTGKDLNMTTAQRIVGGITGTIDVATNALGLKELLFDPIPKIAAPIEPAPAAPKAGQPVRIEPKSGTADALATAGASPEVDNGVIDFVKYKAEREASVAEQLKLAQQQQEALAMAHEKAQPQAAQMSGGGRAGNGGGPMDARPPRATNPTNTPKPSPPANNTVKQQTVFKRFEKPKGQTEALDLETPGTEVDDAEDLYESLEDLKNRDPGQQSNVIKGEFGPEEARRPGPFNMHEYDPKVGDSRLLSFRMRRAGMKRPFKGSQAHHMIPSNEPEAKQVRDFLFEHGFTDINDPDNGVFLSTGKAQNPSAEFKHEFTFDKADYGGEYFKRLEDIFMVEDITEGGIRLRLQRLRSYLQSGKLPTVEDFADLPVDP